MTAVKNILVYGLIVYLAVAGAAYLAQRSFIYFPDRTFPVMPEGERTGFFRAGTQDGLTLIGWYSPPQPGRKIVVYFHGNGGNMAHRADMVQTLSENGYGVLMAGYRGYGGNPGRPSEQGLYNDARAYLDFLRHERRTSLEDVVLYGESLGSGVAVQMAQEYPDVAAVLLVTPLSSMTDIAAKRYFYLPVKYLLKDRFDNLAKVPSLSMPVHYFLAGRDEIILGEFGEAVYQAGPSSKKRYDFADAGHNDLTAHGLKEKVIEVLDGLE